MTDARIHRHPADGQSTPSIGLALGSGGARGLGHILALEAFDELGVKPKIIAGTSIGAVYGAAYASGMTARLIRSFTEETLGRRLDMVRQLIAARSTPVRKLLKLVPLRSALLDAETLLDQIYPSQVAKTFAALHIPLKVVATDLRSRDAAVITVGPLHRAVAASIAIPVLFSPVAIRGRTLIDGGLVNPLPYDLIADDVDVTMAIDVNTSATEADIGPNPSAVEVFISSIQILEKSLTREKLKNRRPDIYVDVFLDRFHALSFHKPHDLLAACAPIKETVKRHLDRIFNSVSGE
ncbi:MAG: patatin-like phospholipase family protein [Hyphomicrobiaceae bacterium]